MGSERQGCTVPTIALIGAATLLSTSSSIAGGLVMYFQGLEALEDTVRDSSGTEVAGMHSKLEGKIQSVTASAETLKHMMYSKERLPEVQPGDWAALTRSLGFAQIASSETLYSSSVFVYPKNNPNASLFYAGNWGDVKRDGSRELVFATYGTHLGNASFIAGDGRMEFLEMNAWTVSPKTGYIQAPLYNWDAAADLNPRMELEPAELEAADFPAEISEAIWAGWSPSRRWFASDQNMYAYTILEMFYDPPPAPHPWSTYRYVEMRVGFLFESFQPPFDEYRTGHPDTTLLLVERSTGAVYASTEGGLIPDWCQQGGSLANRGVTCSLNVANLSATVQDAYKEVSGKAFGEFVKATIEGGDYFLRRELSVRGLELVWMRPASSVDEKVQEALMYLIIFTTIVLVFDLAISIAEVMFIALPMKRLSVAIRSVADMKTEEAAEALKALGASPLREVGVMRAATTLLVENVSEYKTFLPQALLETDEAQVAVHQRDAPGTDGTAAIVFTDIRGSTQLWEACHSGMSVGLRLHNEVVRRCIAEHNGYEVKTIGDAFMVAFDTADEAVLFGLAVQDQLTKAAWPEDLLHEPLCVRDDSGDWVGIRVRIGVTYGPVTAEANTVSKRFDYFGPTVNRAARLESVCVGGAVAVEDTLEATLAPTTSSGAIVTQVGPRTLKGISQAVGVSLMVPKTLPKRAHCVMREASQNQSPKRPDDVQSQMSGMSGGTRRGGGPTSRFGEKLTPVGSATTGQLTQMLVPQFAELSAGLYHLVTTTMAALERTEGSLLTVAGGDVVVGWNASKSCTGHVENAFRFVGMILRALGDNVRCGLSTGPMHSGYVGSQGQRFMTAVGPCSTNAAATMHMTPSLGVQIAYTSTDSTIVDALCERMYLRPVDTRTIGPSQVVIHEMNRKKVEEWCDDKLLPLLAPLEFQQNGEPVNEDVTDVAHACWGDAYCKAYNAKDFEILSRMALTDPVVNMLYQRVKAESPVSPAVWE